VHSSLLIPTLYRLPVLISSGWDVHRKERRFLKMLEVYIDGAAAGNPGPAGIGVFIRGEGHEVSVSEPAGELDNHTAEFLALVRGVEEASKLSSEMISVRSDSKAVVSAVEKRYAKNPLHMDMLNQVL